MGCSQYSQILTSWADTRQRLSEERKQNEALRERIAEFEANQKAYEAIIGEMTYQQVADRFDYIRKVLANNIDRCEDLISDFKGSAFSKNDGAILGVKAVTEQILASLSGLMADDATLSHS